MSAAVRHPRAVELIERVRLRRQIARAVSRLIAVLDDLDTDPDLEPSLGAPETQPVVPQWLPGSTDDREAEDEHGGDILDQGEESLGWPANVSQLGLEDNMPDGDLTAPERHGLGFVQCGADDREDGADEELDHRGLPGDDDSMPADTP